MDPMHSVSINSTYVPNRPKAEFFNAGEHDLISLAVRVLIPSLLIFLTFSINRFSKYDDDFPIVNRTFALEPWIFARIRFAFNSRKILEDAYKKVSRIPP